MARETITCRRLKRRFNRARSSQARQRLHRRAEREKCAWAPRATRPLGYKDATDFDDDWDAWEDYQDRYWGRMRKCALSTVIAHKFPWPEKNEGRQTGPRDICLSSNQVRKLWGTKKVPELLGCGVFACAWVKSPQRVIKITTDPDDVRAMIAARDLPHVVKAFKTYRLANAALDEEGNDDWAYAVVAERLYPMPPLLNDWVESAEALNMEFRDDFDRYYGTSSVDPEDADPGYSIEPGLKQQYVDWVCNYADEDEPGCRRFAHQLVDTVEQLGKRGINLGDLHTGNVGVTKKGVWKILDLGISGSGKQVKAPFLYGIRPKLHGIGPKLYGRKRRRR